MKTKLLALLAGLLLVLGVSSTASAPSAEAAPTTPDAPEAITSPDAPEAVAAPAVPQRVIHNANNVSYWYCSAHRPSGYHVTHSWPYALWNGGAGYWCIAGFYGREYQYWVHVDPAGSSNSWIHGGGYQLCWDAPGWISYCQGPNGTHGPR